MPHPPIYDHGLLKDQIDRLFRNISLFLFFQDVDPVTTTSKTDELRAFEHTELKLASKFSPQMPANLQFIYSQVIDTILEHNPTHDRRRNLTNAEYTSLLNLGDNNEIVIKKTDKGSNIVIMNKSDYMKEAFR